MKRNTWVTATAILFAASTAVYAADNASTSGQSASKSQDHSQQQPSAQSSTGNQSQSTSGQQQDAPKGFVLLEENTVIVMAREPEQHLMRAQEQLAANNPSAAAAELRLTAAYLKMQEARSGHQAKDVLTHWQQRLDDLAGRVQKGDVKAPELARAAAGANYALAKYFDARAQRELGDQGKQVQAGYDLQAAADSFEQALIWNDVSSQNQSSGQGQANAHPVQSNGQLQQQGNTAQANSGAQGHHQLRREDIKAIAEARIAADQLISANSSSSGQSGEAQTAASKSGPSNTSANNNSGNSSNSTQAQSVDPKQAAGDLSKAIDGSSSSFKGDSDSGSPQQSNNPTNK